MHEGVYNFGCTDSAEIFFSKLRSAGLNYNLPSFFTESYCAGVSNKHCLLTFFIWFGLLLYVPGNSYDHVGMVSSPNHTFFLGKLEQLVNQYFVHILMLVTGNNPS